ncbi:MFS transporter [Thiocystis minor]|uniref:MFS transporter n=1 Tax=Thiocystis minor TaxID=61597 RepID=UPI001914B15F|nr:MFS transporter [Thiocystis minor]MBK5964557.1 MFS transporter [Thiocystis minor]
MSTTADALPRGATAADAHLETKPGRWITNWNPEKTAQWESVGKRIARRNLIWSMFAEFLGFAMMGVWGMVVPRLPDAGFTFTADERFWLIAAPGLTGALMRFLYTFTVPVVGGRNWTIASALLLMIPSAGLAYAVSDPSTPFWLLIIIASLAGLGAGNFTSSMVNISFFYPERVKGAALGLNASGGNLGVAWVQFTVPIVIITAGGLALDRAGLIFIPLCLIAAMGAFFFMNNLTCARADIKSFGLALAEKNTFIIAWLYIGTFGSYIGYANTFATLLKSEFPEVSMKVVFVGALLGALVRPIGGWLADRYGGARMTMIVFTLMCIGSLGLVLTLEQLNFPLFLGLFLLLFVAAGMGNGTVYRMIPAAFRARAMDPETGQLDPAKLVSARRLAGGCIGVAGAIGSLGAFFIPRVFAEAGIVGGFGVFLGCYASMLFMTWYFYLRRGSPMSIANV